MDHQRGIRCGFPEVIFGQGKTVEQITAIAERIVTAGEPLLATRLAPEAAAALCRRFPDGVHSAEGRVFHRPGSEAPPPAAMVAVISAGTSDFPVAEEAAWTASSATGSPRVRRRSARHHGRRGRRLASQWNPHLGEKCEHRGKRGQAHRVGGEPDQGDSLRDRGDLAAGLPDRRSPPGKLTTAAAGDPPSPPVRRRKAARSRRPRGAERPAGLVQDPAQALHQRGGGAIAPLQRGLVSEQQSLEKPPVEDQFPERRTTWPRVGKTPGRTPGLAASPGVLRISGPPEVFEIGRSAWSTALVQGDVDPVSRSKRASRKIRDSPPPRPPRRQDAGTAHRSPPACAARRRRFEVPAGYRSRTSNVVPVGLPGTRRCGRGTAQPAPLPRISPVTSISETYPNHF